MYAGLMSGTSLDGIDSVLASFGDDGSVQVHHRLYTPYPPDVRSSLLELFADPRKNSTLADLCHNRLGELYADNVLELIKNYPRQQIAAIGCHGQTVIHRPDADPPFSWQIGDAHTIANATGLPVVRDFRSADMRAGGQGAPFAPFFHNFAFRTPSESRAIVNIGGIANVTILPADVKAPVLGFDTGPGNALSDQWIRKCRDLPYDEGGSWARSQTHSEELLNAMMDDPYFKTPIPKSLDSRYFSLKWLDAQLGVFDHHFDEAVVQSTLAAFTARSIWFETTRSMKDIGSVFVCGGGANNLTFINHLEMQFGLKVQSTEVIGVPPNLVEACTFAWLAKCAVNNVAANIPSVTGARRKVILGSVVVPAK